MSIRGRYGLDVCPTEEFLQLITFNECFVKTWFGDDSKISMDMWNVHDRN